MTVFEGICLILLGVQIVPLLVAAILFFTKFYD